MYETEISGYGLDYGKTYCIDFSRQQRVCKSANSDSGEFQFLIQENKKTVKTIKSNDYTFTDKFWVYKGNLDKKNSDELIIVNFNSASLGLGVTYFTAYIFPDIKNGFKSPLEFPLEEFGEKGNFIYDKKRNETLILVTYWDNFTNLDLKRVPWGTYLVGKWFHYRNGLLKPVFDKPTLARRLLNSFLYERGQTQDNPNAPYIWLQNKRTHQFLKEPNFVEKLIETNFGVVKSFEKGMFTLQLNSGEITNYGLGCCPADYDKTQRLTVKDFGILPQRFMYPSISPDQFTPFIVFNNVVGKKVKLDTYQTNYHLKFIRLWFLE
ncbi:MAG: hypothetical protein K1X72_10425 [Pyrinomonadaceae bacterium]|nr:hypothetical protein [Pyrinomonadaceae bacterium]